ncbi:lactonase family protein [Priestia megaterium]|uniref:lactonase family protein n=1 Tax=Priestia megaterium TaxID=1404 RepID=UPI002079944F|nr:lactonase family protein [Priestia megaterium]USL44200.1 lactonase family protein [Priestia megaterium]
MDFHYKQQDKSSIKNTHPIYAYVGCRTTKERNARGKGINVYRMNQVTGTWTHLQLVENIINPTFLAFDRNEQFLYVVHGDYSEVSSFHVDKLTGRLTFINQQSTEGRNPVHLVVDPTNQFLIVANYMTGTLGVLPINSNGSLNPVCDLVKMPAALKHSTVDLFSKQGVSHPHHTPFDRDGRFVIVPDLGLNKIFIFTIDTSLGKLISHNPAFVETPIGSGPRHIDFHPTSSYAYVANELDSTIGVYHYDSENGEFKQAQIVEALKDGNSENTLAEIVVAPSGNFLYVSNRGQDSITTFSINQKTGLISYENSESTLGKTPRFFTIDPNGNFLYVANEDSDTIITFKVDKETGKLTNTGKIIESESPVCIVFSGNQNEKI